MPAASHTGRQLRPPQRTPRATKNCILHKIEFSQFDAADALPETRPSAPASSDTPQEQAGLQPGRNGVHNSVHLLNIFDRGAVQAGMKKHDYAAVVAAIDRALEVLEAHPARFGPELDTYTRLQEIRTTIIEKLGKGSREPFGQPQ